MDEYTIQALLEIDIDPVMWGKTKILPIPLERVLRGEISIKLNKEKIDIAPTLVTDSLKPVINVDLSSSDADIEINIPMEIMKLYPTETLKDTMIQDVSDYLKEVSKCWEYHNLGFTKALLKKAAKARPALNGNVFTVYGKEGDDILEAVVKQNLAYIRKCWSDYSPLED